MPPEVLATIDTEPTTTLDEVARQLAITIAAAVEHDGDGSVLIGPALAIMTTARPSGST